RRRHTRSKRDWSSDVCSSDLIGAGGSGAGAGRARARQWWSSSGPLLPGSVDVFEDVGESELDRGQDTGEHEQAHRDRGGEAEIGPGATEGDAIDHRDQDVRAASGVLTGGEGAALGEQLDRVEVVEVERE